VVFDVIVFPFAALVLFRDLSHKNAWTNNNYSYTALWQKYHDKELHPL